MADEALVEAELPLESVGTRLQRAREAAKLSRADIAARTKIAERHLASIEDNQFSALASSTYAVGFARSYARAVGLDEKEIAEAVRTELGAVGSVADRNNSMTFEPGDPARVPSARLAWVAGLGALFVVLAIYAFWRSYYAPAVTLPSPSAKPATAAASVTPALPPVAPAATPAGGAVVFTAKEAGIWVKFYDASGRQLMQKQMAVGETYVVPADANGPQIWTGRPDALAITIGGKAVPPLADKQVTVKNQPVTAAALLARPAPVPTATAALPAQTNPSTVSP